MYCCLKSASQCLSRWDWCVLLLVGVGSCLVGRLLGCGAFRGLVVRWASKYKAFKNLKITKLLKASNYKASKGLQL